MKEKSWQTIEKRKKNDWKAGGKFREYTLTHIVLKNTDVPARNSNWNKVALLMTKRMVVVADKSLCVCFV